MEEIKKLSDRIEEDGITIQTDRLGGLSEDGMSRRWAVALHRPGGRIFSLSEPYESNDKPTALGVLSLITRSCSVINRSADWREWASEYVGDDPEYQEKHFSPEAFNQWREINDLLRIFLGHREHEAYLYETEGDG